MMRRAQLPASPSRETFWRTLQTFCVTRIVIALVLLAYLGFDAVRNTGSRNALLDWKICFAYLMLAVGFTLLSVYARKRFTLQLVAQLVVDIGAISLLYVVAGGVKSGLAILYLFPLAGCAILMPMVPALFFVSIVTLVLLAESGYELLNSTPDASPSRAGLYGAAFFAAIYLINRLAAKLIKQERLATQRGRELLLQEAINGLVIADMGDGILVVGPDTQVFAGNASVERMLGLPVAHGRPQFRLVDLPSLAPVADAYSAWLAQFRAQGAANCASSAFVMVKSGEDIASMQGRTLPRHVRREPVTHLKLRFVPVEIAGLTEQRTVIFLQDVTEIENQAQQLKLASMGRLTASIAHEVRNPLSAISHAASLLKEDITDPAQMRLLKIVGDNVGRLNRMIEDILKLSRKAQSHTGPLQLAPFLAELLDEFQETHSIAPGMIELDAADTYQVRFDPLHLREVLGNLLVNALRYASGSPGSIRIQALLPDTNRLELHVQDDGPAITPEVRAHLFEPFYTTSSKGTGLGLYVARELCLNNDAMLDYEYRMDISDDGADEPSGRFVITFAAQEPY
ncbi:PAS domain-containing sensor histidine kinase [Noviherbaspirillum sp. UKPF54]|uniref:sensor histidine kinase n=1 Tax=Noviherbaspirillum sp. UKPF54 TaxID=2601898 RepID=UPI0011B1772C|nr:ATP-binding protein [Noviherbaspirillum sp. UKPF54]QDZ28906.1 two-component sensor histidine kinase [Noviherbaspirillum sp. UKPF54]